jgi:hypothetical protein
MNAVKTHAIRGTLLAVLITLAAVAPASAIVNTKSYSLVISPTSPAIVAGGATVTITATLRNESGPQLGSANLTPPSNFTVTSASIVPPSAGTAAVSPSCPNVGHTGPCVQLRSLALAAGQSVTVSMIVATPACVTPQSAFAWKGEAKTTSNFTLSQEFALDTATSSITTTLDGACKLAFGTQPHSVVINQPITGTDYDPTGPPVTVQVLDSGNNVVSGSTATVSVALAANPGAATLGGTTVTSASGGVATFSNLTVDQPAAGYALGASSGTLTPATSSTYTAVTTSTACTANTPCTANAGNAAGNSQIVAAPGAPGTLVESVNANNGTPLNCTGYTSADPNTYAFFTTTDRGKVGTITIDTPLTPLGSQTISQYLAAQDICFGAPFDFTVKGGGLAAPGTLPDGSAGFIGLLPDCPVAGGPCHDRSSDMAVADPNSPIGYDIVLVADVPKGLPGDPMWR